ARTCAAASSVRTTAVLSSVMTLIIGLLYHVCIHHCFTPHPLVDWVLSCHQMVRPHPGIVNAMDGKSTHPRPLSVKRRGVTRSQYRAISPFTTAFEARHPSPRDGEGPGVTLTNASSYVHPCRGFVRTCGWCRLLL